MACSSCPPKGQPGSLGPLSWLFIAPQAPLRNWPSPPSNVNSCGRRPRDAARWEDLCRCAVPHFGEEARPLLQFIWCPLSLDQAPLKAKKRSAVPFFFLFP